MNIEKKKLTFGNKLSTKLAASQAYRSVAQNNNAHSTSSTYSAVDQEENREKAKVPAVIAKIKQTQEVKETTESAEDVGKQALASNTNIIKKKPKISTEEYKEILTCLTQHYPNVFSSAEPKLLAIGTSQEIMDSGIVDFSKSKMRAFFNKYCKKYLYIKQQIKGSPRYNLSGEFASEVTEQQAIYVEAKLKAYAKMRSKASKGEK